MPKEKPKSKIDLPRAAFFAGVAAVAGPAAMKGKVDKPAHEVKQEAKQAETVKLPDMPDEVKLHFNRDAGVPDVPMEVPEEELDEDDEEGEVYAEMRGGNK